MCNYTNFIVMDELGNMDIVEHLECNSSIQVETSQRRAPTATKFKANNSSQKLCLSYFSGTASGRIAVQGSHHTFGKLNRSVSGPEPDAITLDDGDSTGEPELGDYFSMFANFPFEASKPLPLLQPRKANPTAGWK